MASYTLLHIPEPNNLPSSKRSPASGKELKSIISVFKSPMERNLFRLPFTRLYTTSRYDRQLTEKSQFFFFGLLLLFLVHEKLFKYDGNEY